MHCFFIAPTGFGVGLTSTSLGLVRALELAGLALLLQPGLARDISHLDRPIIFAIGAGCMLLAALYLLAAAFVRQPLRFRDWSLRMPSLKLALGQALIGPLNFALVAACLYEALAATADISYLGVATVYVIANIATLVSHVPGGLGVIESVVLVLLPGQQVIGALILFRVVYFLVPLCLGSLLLVLLELTRTSRGGVRRSDQPG